MKLYTRDGDDGTTSLFGGERVAKTSDRIRAYGTVDELNCALGLAAVECDDDRMLDILRRVQAELFVIGGDLATRGGSDARGEIVPVVSAEDIERIEQWIDQLCDPLPPMKHFILPGGSELSARLHLARGVCRRAERAILALGQHEEINERIVPYMNRLGDLLFAAARRANQVAGVEDIPWRPKG
jgi:cob(I)alamin adenosyltransferase